MVAVLIFLPVAGYQSGFQIGYLYAQGSHYIIQDVVNATTVYADTLDALSGGDIVSNTDLNMSGSEIQEGVFHTGDSFPSGPVEGQFFYRTDLDDFYVYNGSGWETPSGEAGPAGQGIIVEEAWSFLVFVNSTSTYLLSGDDGEVDWNSADDEAVINAAFGNLTSGRYWKEKVVLKGNFEIDGTIEIPSYTILEVYGNITLADSADCDMIENDDQAGGDTNIEIIGGRWDGNKAGQSAVDLMGLDFVDVDNFTIRNTEFYNCRSTGTVGYSYRLAECTNGKLIDCVADDGEGVGIMVSGQTEFTENIYIIRPRITNHDREGIILGYDGDDDYGGRNLHVLDGYIYNNADNGIDMYAPADHCSIQNTFFQYNNNSDRSESTSGEIAGGHSNRNVTNCIIANNIIYSADNQLAGIYLTGTNASDNNLIFGNRIEGGERGIWIQGDNNRIIGNHILNPSIRGIEVRPDSDENIISDNYFEGIPSGQYGILWRDDPPYPASNIAHGNYFNNAATGRTIGGHTATNYERDNFDYGSGWIS